MSRYILVVLALQPVFLPGCSAASGDPAHCKPSNCQIVTGVDSAGTCQYAAKANGTRCDDDNSCTVFDTCQNGNCGGGSVLADGTACDDDNVCTLDDHCQQGTCVGGNDVVCGNAGSCSAVSTCDPTHGCLVSDVGPCTESLAALTLTGCSIAEYTAPVRIGGTSFDLLLDTGSSTTAVAAGACANCTNISPRYQATNGVDQHAVTSAGYIDGSGWYAAIYADTVQAGRNGTSGYGDAATMRIASITRQVNFFTGTHCGTSADVNAYQGIWGLGPDGGLRPGTDPFTGALAATRSMAYDAFSLQLCDVGGRMWLGGYNPAAGDGAIIFTPMLNATNGDGNHYAISLEDMRVGRQSLGVSSYTFGPTMVDSGTSATYLPQAAYTALKQQLAAEPNVLRVLDGHTFDADEPSERYSYPSPTGASPTQIDAALPWLTIVVPSGGTAPSHTLNLPPTKSYLTAWRRNESVNAEYLYSFTAFPADLTILGSSMLKAHIVVFDRAGGRIGFLKQGDYCSASLPVSG